MNAEEIKELIQLMEEKGLVELEVEEDGRRIKLRKKEHRISLDPTLTQAPMQESPFLTSSGEAERGTVFIKAPMVGTFYRAPAPDAPAFVDVGDEVESGQTVCIVEAMKLMNEIKAEVKGKVVEIMAENGEPVDYGQNLFKIKLES